MDSCDTGPDMAKFVPTCMVTLKRCSLKLNTQQQLSYMRLLSLRHRRVPRYLVSVALMAVAMAFAPYVPERLAAISHNAACFLPSPSSIEVSGQAPYPGRRHTLSHSAAISLSLGHGYFPAAVAAFSASMPMPVEAKDEKKQLGYVPPELLATYAGQKIVTPNGLEYEAIEVGTTGTSKRDGPPRGGSRVWVKFTGHIDGFDGKIFDSSFIRGQRKPSKPDYAEITLNFEPSISNGMFEALKLMKTGAKGRFVQPPLLCYADGQKSFSGDEDAEVKTVPANSTTYYTVELLQIVKP